MIQITGDITNHRGQNIGGGFAISVDPADIPALIASNIEAAREAGPTQPRRVCHHLGVARALTAHVSDAATREALLASINALRAQLI